jgi:hypothetical protein
MAWEKVERAELLLAAIDFRLDDRPVTLLYPDELKDIKEGFDALRDYVKNLVERASLYCSL